MTPAAHIDALEDALHALRAQFDRIDRWGQGLGRTLCCGGRLLAAGNGGSAAHAQHLTSELVGRYVDDRQPFSAIALHADTSTLTALANDYPATELFARQVRAHGRPGDVFIALSTSGRSPNLVTAMEHARRAGMVCWAVTGGLPNPLAEQSDDVLAVAASATCTVQEAHQVVVHLLCEAIEREVCR